MTQRSKAYRRAVSTAALVLLCSAASAGDPPTADEAAAAEEKERELLRSIASKSRSAVKAEDASVEISGHPVLGDAGAVLTLIEFGDMQCGFCRRHLLSVMPVLLERYVGSGRMRYVYFDFPVEQRHAEARGAAVAVRCAADQNAVLQMRERLYARPAELRRQSMPPHAEALGLDGARFSLCLADDTKAEAVNRDLSTGQQLGVRGTPTFLLGYSNGQSVHVKRRIVGAQPLEVFESAIGALLAQPTESMAQMR
jgi:protein-disulfide isomerase